MKSVAGIKMDRLLATIFTCIIFFINTTTIFARQYTSADTALVAKLLKESRDSSNINPRKSVQLADSAVKIAQKINYTEGYVMGISAKAQPLSSLGHPDEAITLCTEALKIADANGYRKLLATIHMQLGSAYDDKGEFKKAITQYDISLKLLSQLPDSPTLSMVYCDLGVLMHHMHDFESSLGIYA